MIPHRNFRSVSLFVAEAPRRALVASEAAATRVAAGVPPLVALQAGGSHEVHRIVEAIRRHGGRPEAIISRGITKAPYESTWLAKLWSQRGHTHHCIGKQGVITLSFNTSPNGKSSVVALSDFRRIALSMPETEETNGMGHPNFRTGRKSFAAIEESMAVIRLTREQQATFVATAPEVFAPDSSGWGRLGNTVIRLEAADEKTIQVAVATAWSNVAEVVNASEIVDVADVQIAAEFVNVEVSDTAEVADVVTAADVNATVVKVGNAGEVDDEVSAVAFVDLAEVVEANDAAEVVNATFVVNPAEVAEVSASDVPNGAEVVEIEDAGVSVEPRNHLLSAPRQVANARNHGGPASFESSRFHFEYIELAVPILIDSLPDGVSLDGGLDFSGPFTSVSEDAA
jgi:hypothetical protein